MLDYISFFSQFQGQIYAKGQKKSPKQKTSDFMVLLHNQCERYPGRQLDSGTLAAPGKVCLVLLHSCPDTVRSSPSRKTQMSSLPVGGSFTDISIPILFFFVNRLLFFLFFAKFPEKTAHQSAALLLQNTFCKLYLMIKFFHLQQI